MLIEQAILTQLNTDASITALVSTSVYYVKAKQDVTQPYIVISKVDARRELTHDGPAHMSHSTFQIFSYALTYTVCKQLAGYIQASLEGFSGNLGSSPYVSVGLITYDDETDDYDSDLGLYYVAQTFTITHYE